MATEHSDTGVVRRGSTAAHGVLQTLESKDESRRHFAGHLRWDEEAIAAHDKERGTRMKIDEPPTPYHRDNRDYKGVSAAALRQHLEKVALNDAGQALSGDEADAKKKEEFERRRRLHYSNEKRVVPGKTTHEDSDEEEEEGEEE